jgi:hypothetical protein
MELLSVDKLKRNSKSTTPLPDFDRLLTGWIDNPKNNYLIVFLSSKIVSVIGCKNKLTKLTLYKSTHCSANVFIIYNFSSKLNGTLPL